MKATYRFIGLLGSLVCFGSGGNVYGEPQNIPDEPPDEPSTVMEMTLPDIWTGFRTGFAMKFVRPAPGIDYEIVKVTPDPEIDYKIRIIGPTSRKSLTGIDKRSGEIMPKIPWQK